MSPKSVRVNIKVDPSTRPRIPPVVAFPGEVVEFTVEGGEASVFVPGGNQIFVELESDVFTVESGVIKELRINPNILEIQGSEKSVASRGALFVKYAIHCTQDGETYFAEGNSAPIIIIPRGLGG
jgi:hypothetical protein